MEKTITMKDFLTDEEMVQLESSQSAPDFLTDEQMASLEKQAPQPTGLKADLGKRFETARVGVEKAQQGKQTVPSAVLQTTGQIAGAAGDIGFAALKAATPEFIEKPVGAAITKGVQKIAETKPVQLGIEKYQEFKTQYPEAAADIEALGNIASILPPIKGAQLAAKPTAKVTGKIIKRGQEIVESGALKRETKFVESRAKAFDDLIKNTQTPRKVQQKSLSKGYNVTKTLASDDRFVPEVIDGLIHSEKAVSAVQDTASPLAKIVRGVIETEGSVVSIEMWRKQAYREIADLRLRGDEYNRVKNAIDRDFDSYVQNFADERGNIPLTIVDDVKKAKYENINWNNPDLLSADRAISRASRKTIEDSIKDVSIRNMNYELGKLYDAQEMLEALNGRAVRGGKLSKLFARGIGAGIGSQLGIPGGILGAITADQLVVLMQSNYFNNPLMKRIVGEIKLEKPEIFERAAQIIKERGNRLQLPAPTELMTTSEFPGYRGVLKLKK